MVITFNFFSFLRNILFLTTLLTASAALAGPPFVTDDPEPVVVDSWEINYAINKTWTENTASAGIPSIDINYGFTPNVQLHIQPKYAYEQESGHQHFGFDNTEMGVKYRFIDTVVDNQHYMVSIYPMIQLPTGDKKLGETRGKTQLFLPVWGQLDIERWNIYGGTGYRINRGLNNKNSWFLGLTTLYKLSEDLKMGAELYRESAPEHGDPYSSGFNLGGIYEMTKDYHLLFSMGKALNNVASSNELSGYLGLQVIY